MVSKKHPQKFRTVRGQVSRTQTPKPCITLEPTPLLHSEFSKRDETLKRLHLKPSDILSEAVRGSELSLVTKNGLKIRVKK